MHMERMEMLLEMVKQIMLDPPEDKPFNINEWRGETECGYSACVIGYAATHPPFMEMGLRLDCNIPVFGGERNWEAVTSFFEIPQDIAFKLFFKRGYAPPMFAKGRHVWRTDSVNLYEVYNKLEAVIEVTKEVMNAHKKE